MKRVHCAAIYIGLIILWLGIDFCALWMSILWMFTNQVIQWECISNGIFISPHRRTMHSNFLVAHSIRSTCKEWRAFSIINFLWLLFLQAHSCQLIEKKSARKKANESGKTCMHWEFFHFLVFLIRKNPKLQSKCNFHWLTQFCTGFQWKLTISIASAWQTMWQNAFVKISDTRNRFWKKENSAQIKTNTEMRKTKRQKKCLYFVYETRSHTR